MIPISKACLGLALILISSPAISQEAAAPAELQKLRSTYEAEIKRVMEVPKRRYIEALERLQTTYTQEGALQKALLVKEEIQLISEKKVAESKMAIDERILNGSEWLWGSGGTLTLERNGEARHTTWSVSGTWEKKRDGTISLQRPGNDPPMIITFSDETLTNAVLTSHRGAQTTLRRVIK